MILVHFWPEKNDIADIKNVFLFTCKQSTTHGHANAKDSSIGEKGKLSVIPNHHSYTLGDKVIGIPPKTLGVMSP